MNIRDSKQNHLSDSIIQEEIKHKLEVAEEQYRLITENANDLIAVLNKNLEFEYINENVHKNIVGYSKKDLIGYTNLELIHPEDRKKTALAVSKILRKSKGSHQLRFRTKSGEYKWLEINSKKFLDSMGNTKILNISRDITKRKKIEEDLKKNIQTMDLLNQIITSVNQVQDLDDPLEKILKIILKLLDFDSGGVYIVNNDTNTANLVTHKGFPPEIIQDLNQVKIDQDHYKRVFIDKEILILEHYLKINPELAKKLSIRSYVSIPLPFKDAVIGALNIASKSRNHFSYEEKTIFQSI